MDTQENTSVEVTETVPVQKKSFLKTALPFFIIIILAILAAVAYWYFIVSDKGSSEDGTAQNTTQSDASSDSQNYTIAQDTFDIASIAPDVNHPIQFGDSVPQEIRATLEAQAAPIRTRLAADVTRADDWFNLAIIYHNANDYEGAAEIWKFLAQVIPTDTTSRDNLGKVYHFSLPDYPKSESYFNQSLAIDPTDLNAYLGLFELYEYSYKTDTTAAADILNKAITQFPDRLDLVLTLGVYYEDQGNYVKAREVLEVGLDKARDAANVDMVTAFGKELERLPQ